MKVLFIGFGNLAKAIARGLLKHGHYTIFACAPSLPEGINKDGITTHFDNKAFIAEAEVIILAVKPLMMRAVVEEIAPLIPVDSLVISVAAGLSLPWFATYCGSQHAIIRSMPNTPAAVGLAATPLCANQLVSAKQRHNAETIFSSIGITTWVENEQDLDTFTALSGSGPAYVFLFMESMIRAGVMLGLSESIATTFVLQTIEGALALAKQQHLGINQLRHKVTSAGGTTAAALQILDPQLKDLMFAAIQAASNRAKELGTIT